MRDDNFEPRPGRIRSTPPKQERRYLQDVLKGIARAGGRSGAHKGRFNGTHGGRGSGAARVLEFRDHTAAFRARRVIVKSRVVKLKGKRDAVAAHLRYILRDGVTRKGAPGELYDADHDRADGKDERGHNLVIAPDYITQGIRERAADIVTLDLGPRTDLDIRNDLKAEVTMERFTSLDRRLLRDVDDRGMVRPAGSPKDAFEHSLRAGRLRTLERLGLAEEQMPGRWRLADDLEPALRAMGERGDFIKTMHREMKRMGLKRRGADMTIYDPADGQGASLVGRVVARGLADELNDRQYLIVDGVDGRAHYVDIGDGDRTEPVPQNSIIAITAKPTGPRQVDRTVTEIAAAHDGRYSLDIHMRYDPTATQAFVESHIRRLEAMRRKSGLVEREPDGTWIIAADHAERGGQFERAQVRRAPVTIETLSALSLERQVGADGATWLDRELVAKDPIVLRDAGFGKQTRDGLIRRQQWLIEQGLAECEQDQIVYRANLLSVLRRRELSRVSDQLSDELGIAYTEVKPGAWVEGVYKRSIDLASGRFALIEKSREFTLAPWRPVLERSRGRVVSGLARGDTISWSLGRRRSGPSVS